ncbi:MAG: hypothetical protein QF573_05470 [Chloroflexota bacterium]|nr:hypothetical protein [Chloroflexota bacterium]
MRTAAMLFLLAAAIYMFSTGAHAYSVDEITNYASARALVQTGTPDLRSQIDVPFPTSQLLKVEHPDEPRVTGRYGLLSWLALVPAYAIAAAVSPDPVPVGPTFPEVSHVLPLTGLLFNPVIAAVLVALTYLLARSLGLSRAAGLAVAAITGLARPGWVYAKTLSSVPLAATLLLAALLALTGRRGGTGRLAAILSGLLAGLATATRSEYAMFAPILLFAALASRPGRGRVAVGGLWVLAWVAVVVPGVGLYNLYRAGSMIDFGYPGQTFLWATDRAHIGLYGVLASPGFGLFVYMPAAVLGLWGLLTGAGERWARWAMAVAAFTAILIYGTFNDWEGGVSWGPRYLTGVVPLLAVGVGCLLSGGAISRAARFSAGVLIAWGFGVAALGVLFDYQRGWRNLWDVGARPEQIVWDPHFSPIGAHLRLLRQWLDGVIEPDTYLGWLLGVWTVPALAGAVTLVLVAAVVSATRFGLRGVNRIG